ncbi:MAG TPA: thioredoxin-like domain-containing protein [Chthoniobacterales bacterium]|nr:thioredoxin-like domain-containing protein [Chthoniobacterales bacterium]
MSIFAARAAQLPLTAKDVGLMVRMGYSNSVMAQELSTRHFADTIDSTKEADLIKAGLPLELLNALKSGTYSVPPEEIARAQEQIAAEAKRSALAAEQSRKFNTLYQDQLVKERAVAQVQAAYASGIYNFVKGDLVRPRNGVLVHADDEALSHKKLIAFYFSAHWCAPCRKFTPQLVEYYNRIAAQHPEFEIIFFSLDKSESAMEAYMRETNMPWPAIDYQKLKEKELLKKNAGDGIPSLVLVDQTGKLLSSTYAGSQYLGPAKVLADLDAIFAGNSLPRVAQSQSR